MEHADADITRILSEPGGIAPDGVAALLPLVYEQLRRAAAVQLQREAVGHTLQPTALVHEAFVRLAGPREIPWANRAHYYAAAAQAMRQILIDHARSRGARKAREAAVSAFSDLETLANQEPEAILAVDHALSRLEGEDPEAAAIVKLRFFAGLSVEQAALALGVSPRTAARLWSLARARLHRFLTEAGAEQNDE
ncbi:MAG: ECF-type sigma factor [Phycisphaerales bacterium]|jgi:RNA polymerase sigma factor (TIGR02999 family)|nr:ECF-type sigma factor [Phycisphaerales bacterium]